MLVPLGCGTVSAHQINQETHCHFHFHFHVSVEDLAAHEIEIVCHECTKVRLKQLQHLISFCSKFAEWFFPTMTNSVLQTNEYECKH
jgi:hypothetical protein